MQQFDGTEHITMYHEPERTSIAAILGLVLGCIGCCGGITAIPGIFLSIFGIVGISRSNGRIGGMGFAIAGLLISLLTLALWGGIAGVSVAGLNWVENEAAAPTVVVLKDIEAGNYDAARAGLGLPAAAVSDEVLAEFAAGYMGTLGAVDSETDGIMELLEGYGVVLEQSQRYNGRPAHIPIPVKFDSGFGLVVIEINPNGSNNGSTAPVRMYIVDLDGNEYVLPPYDWVNPNPDADMGGRSDDVDLPGVDVEDFSDDGDSTDSVDQADDGP